MLEATKSGIRVVRRDEGRRRRSRADAMIALLVNLLILCLIAGLIIWVIRQLPLPHPFGLIAQVVVAVVVLIILLQMLLGLPWPAVVR